MKTFLKMAVFQFRCLLMVALICLGKTETCQKSEESEISVHSEGIIKEVRPMGYQQCSTACKQLTDCGDFVFNRNQLSCQLIKTNETNSVNTNDGNAQSAGSCATCGESEICVGLTSGSNVCIKVLATCPNNDLPFGSKCYFFSDEYKDWAGAQSACRNKNGFLVTIDTVAVSQMISDAVKTLSGSFYTGGNDRETNTIYVWEENNQPFNFTNWYPSEPGGASTQDCVVIHSSHGTWADDSCFGLKRFICQYNL